MLISAILVFWAGLSATGYLAIVYFQKVQHAGANVQTIASYLSGVPAVMLGLGLGYFISRALTRKQVAVLTPMAGSVVALVQFTTTHIWQTVVLAFIGGPMFAAFAISLAPMILQLLPRSGGMGELLGKLVAPFSLFAVAFSFLAAWAVDVTGNYRVIWLFPAAAGIIQSVIMCFLKVPPGHERAELDGLVERMSESILDQMIGRDRSLLGRGRDGRRCRLGLVVRHGPLRSSATRMERKPESQVHDRCFHRRSSSPELSTPNEPTMVRRSWRRE